MLIVDKLKGNLYTRIKKHMTKKKNVLPLLL